MSDCENVMKVLGEGSMKMLDVSAEELRSSRNRQEAAAKDVNDSSA